MRRSPFALIAASVLTAGVFALVVNLASSTVTVAPSWLPAVWIAAGLVLAALTAVEILRHRGTAPAVTDLEPAMKSLSYRMADGLRRQDEGRETSARVALQVRWRPMAAIHVDHPENVYDTDTDTSAPARAVGSERIAEFYRQLPHGRLVVLGRSGAGKTVLVTRLARDLLAEGFRRIPVFLNVRTWDPATPLRDWLPGQLVEEQPWLSAEGGRETAAKLLAADLLLPILDGFDEIAPRLRAAALAQLNDADELPLVLTSRPEEYTDAVEAGKVLRGAAGIVLVDVSVDDLAAYLPRSATGRRAGVWDPVLGQLRGPVPDATASLLREALTTPLMVYLAGVVYADGTNDPAELLDRERFRTRWQLEQHLLDAYVPAVFRRPSSGGRLVDPDGAVRWLSFLAAHASRSGTHDLAWWQLRDAVTPGSRLRAIALVLSLCAAPALAALTLTGLRVGVPLLASVLLGILIWSNLLGRMPTPQPTRTRLRLRGRGGPLLALAVLGFPAWLGLAALTFPMAEHRQMLAIAVGGVAVLLLVFGLEAPSDPAAMVTPAHSLAADRVKAIRDTLVYVVVFGVVGVHLFGSAGFAFGLLPGVQSGLMKAWGQWLVVARGWLPLTGRLPWRLRTFLAEAHHRGVLRQVGAAYQFRHVRLRDQLAGVAEPAETTEAAGPGDSTERTGVTAE